MANNYQYQNNNQQPLLQMQPQYQYQYQQLFPQPQGNVYLINNSLEVANVPMSAGLSVGMCFSEGLCYLKSMQNGSPTFMVYKLIPYSAELEKQKEETPQEEEKNNYLTEILTNYEKRLKLLEDQLKKTPSKSVLDL